MSRLFGYRTGARQEVGQLHETRPKVLTTSATGREIMSVRVDRKCMTSRIVGELFLLPLANGCPDFISCHHFVFVGIECVEDWKMFCWDFLLCQLTIVVRIELSHHP